MRVRSSGGHGQGRSPGHNPERAAAFRRSHKVGQKVTGRFVGWERGSLAWVNIGGQPLLARLEADPAVGGHVLFMVMSLYPEIVLKQLDAAGRGPAGGAPTLTEAARSFTGARSGFKAALAGLKLPAGIPGRPGVSRGAFLDALAGDPEALGGYVEVLEAQAMVNALLASKGNVRYLYMPWLFPEGGGAEMLIKTLMRQAHGGAPDENTGPPLRELVFDFNLTRLGPGQARIVFIEPKAVYKVQLERPEHIKPLQAFLQGFDFSGIRAEMVCGGVEKLPDYARSGVMGEMLSPRAGLISGVNIKV